MTRSLAFHLVALSVLAACSKDAGPAEPPGPASPTRITEPRPTDKPAVKTTPVPPGSLREKAVYLELAVYVPVTAGGDPRAVATDLVKQALPGVPLVGEPNRETPLPWIEVDVPDIDAYAPPNADMLRYAGKGLSDEELAIVPKSRSAVVLRTRVAGANADATHRKLLAVIGAIADRLEGFPWDEETRQVFSREAWKERLEWKQGPPNVTRHVTMHAYRDGELIRIVTLGMAKFGYPDVVANQVAGHNTTSMGNLINLVCQTLIERGEAGESSALDVSLDDIANPAAKRHQNTDVLPGAQRKARIALLFTPPEDGDASNRLIELRFKPQAGESVQAAQVRVIDSVYGSQDEIIAVEHDHPELQAAAAQARKELEHLRERFAKAPQAGESLQVKVPFATPDGSEEWMWVDVTSWEANTIRGVLINDPFDIPDLKAGAHVELDQASVFDYIHYRLDGTTAGDLTGPVIERLAVERRSK